MKEEQGYEMKTENDTNDLERWFEVEKAKICDVPQMYQLNKIFADRGEKLSRPLS